MSPAKSSFGLGYLFHQLLVRLTSLILTTSALVLTATTPLVFQSFINNLQPCSPITPQANRRLSDNKHHAGRSRILTPKHAEFRCSATQNLGKYLHSDVTTSTDARAEALLEQEQRDVSSPLHC